VTRRGNNLVSVSKEHEGPEADAFPARILIVEDDPTIRMMLRRAFAHVAEVLIADNGVDALAMIHKHEPEFVVTDLMLPQMDGLTMITQARRTFVGACVPILVMTASPTESVLLDCFRQGADDFMVKPFSITELRTRVSSIYLRQQVARDMNPLTRLPGNMVIKREIALRLQHADPFAVGYIDLDHFKPFNDSRGFDAGDRAISLMGDLMREYAGTRGDAFIGHVGGDDFVVICSPDAVEEMADFLHKGWRKKIAEFYNAEELLSGMVEVKDRKGDPMTVPLLSMSIGVLTSRRNGLDDLRKIAQVSAEVKKMAKAIPGNSLFIDRRTVYP
jgi:diguanylate cyclase (GGDEF)-like protein